MTSSEETKSRAAASNVVVVHPDPDQRSRWAGLLPECNVWQANDVMAANSLAEDQDAHLLVAPWPWASGLLRKRRRLPARPVLLLGGEADHAIVQAVAAGVEVTHWPDDVELHARVMSLIQKNRVRAPRFQVEDLRVEWGPATARRSATGGDVALDGFSFTLPVDSILEGCMPASRLTDVRLYRQGALCVSVPSATVRYLSADKTTYRVGCSFDSAGTGVSHALSAETSIRQPLRLAGVVQAALNQKRLRLERPDHSLLLDCEGVVDIGKQQISITSGPGARLDPLDVVRGSFEFAGELYQFTSAVTSTEPLEIRLPNEVTVRQRRASTRHDLTLALAATATSRLTGKKHLAIIKDLSATGCLLEFERDALYPRGTELSEIKLGLPQGSVTLEGVVTHAARGERGLKIGIEFKNTDDEALLVVAQFLVTQRWPTLESGAQASFEELFDLFARSGLLKVSHIEALKPGMAEVKKTFAAVSNIANTLFRSIVIREKGRVVGHVSSVRVYQNTWYVQHLAAASGSPASALHVNLGVADFFDQLRELEFFKMGFYGDNNWTGRAFGTFAQRIESPTVSMTRKYVPLLIRVDVTEPAEKLPPGVECFEAGPSEFKQLQHFFVQNTPTLALKADDLLAEHFDLHQLDADFGKYGLHRRRRCWMVTDQNGIVAVAKAELTSPGLSLFDYLNSVRFSYAHANPALPKEKIIRLFISTIMPHYAALGVPAIRLFIHPSEMPDYEKLGFAPARVLTEWICHRRANRQLAEHIYGLGEGLRERAKRLAPLIAAGKVAAPEEPAGQDLSISSVNLPVPIIAKKRSAD